MIEPKDTAVVRKRMRAFLTAMLDESKSGVLEGVQAEPGSARALSGATGAEIIVRALVRNGVDTIFGLPGGAVLHIYDELWRYRDRIRHFLVRHEQGALHAAEGYARASGKVGVALVTSGPGATNAVTGIATAYMDSVPLVVITGQVPLPMIGTDAFQEVDTFGLTLPIVKHSYLVKDVADLDSIIDEAFQIASSGKPGPVVIDIPKNLTAELCAASREMSPGRRYRPRALEISPETARAAADALLSSRRPLFYVGGGIVASGAAKELTRIAETLRIPVTPTLMGLGGFPSAHELSLGMLGMHGTYAANTAVGECDLLFAVGVRFDDRVTGKLATFAPNAKIVHIDIEPANIGKIRMPQLSIVADAKKALSAVREQIALDPRCSEYRNAQANRDWWADISKWQTDAPLTSDPSADEIKPQMLVEELYNVTGGNALVVTDVGQHQMWMAQFYPVSYSRQWITSGGLGTMGFGLPAAIGAKLACPDKPVVAVVGDGGFQMTNQEIITAIQYDIPLKVVIMNNGYLGMVRQWQEMFYDRTYSEVDLSVSPDFVKLAEAYGATGLRATKPAELRSVLEAGIGAKGTAIMDIVVTKEENVFPIIPPGQDSRKMILR